MHGTLGEPKNILSGIPVRADACPWHPGIPPAASHPRRHQVLQSGTSATRAGSPAGTATVPIIRNNNGCRWKPGLPAASGARRLLSFGSVAAFLPSSSPISYR